MNIRVDLNYPIKDGTEVVFRSPVDCSQITGLKVYYPENGITASREFALADAHGNNVGDIDHLFAENVVVKVILDVTTSMAFVQNADTNAYIEKTFVKTVNGNGPDKNGNVQVAGGGGSSTLTVTVDENDVSSHTAEQVFAHVQNGGTAQLLVNGFYYSLNSVCDGAAFFSSYNDEGILSIFELYGDKVAQNDKEFVPMDFFDNTIGDISAALDELHAYAEALKGGDAV